MQRQTFGQLQLKVANALDELSHTKKAQYVVIQEHRDSYGVMSTTQPRQVCSLRIHSCSHSECPKQYNNKDAF